MPIAFNSSDSFSGGSSSSKATSATATIPAAAGVGDVIFLVFNATNLATSATAPTLTVASTGTAWTQIGTTQACAISSFSYVWSSVWWLKVTAADLGATVTLGSTTSLYLGAAAAGYSGVYSAAPVDASGHVAATSGEESVPTPTVTSPTATDWLLYLGGMASTQSLVSIGVPSGTTLRDSYFSYNEFWAGIADSGTGAGAGTVGGGSFTCGYYSGNVMWTLAVAQASAGLSVTPGAAAGAGAAPAPSAGPGAAPAAAGAGAGAAPQPTRGSAVTGSPAGGGGAAPAPSLGLTSTAAPSTAAGAGSVPASTVTGAGFVFPTATAAGAGQAAQVTPAALSAPRPAGPAGLGAAPRPSDIGVGLVLAGQPAGAGAAPAPGNLVYLPPIFMGQANDITRPLPRPGCSQVAVAPPDGSQWIYLGSVGHVSNLKYSFVMPGGCDKMSCTVLVPAGYRHQAFSPGWQVRVWRGGHICWTGRLDEPGPSATGWSMTAVGDGQRAQDFTAIWSGTWPAGQPDDAVNQAIARGLNWTNPGVGQPSWAWFGQAVDSGSQTIASLLNLVCTRGTGTWYANSQPGGLYGPAASLSVFPIPSVPNRLLLVTTPVARTLGAQVNRLVLRYQSSADNVATNAAAAYAVTTVSNAADIAQHQPAEAYLDLSSAGVMTSGAAQAAGNAILSVYQRASYTGTFTAAPGQLMTMTGTPIDPGTDQAGTVVKCIITDFGFGGEVTPAQPAIFPVGGYEWDDQNLIASISAFQTLDTSLTGLISAQQTISQPITVTAGG